MKRANSTKPGTIRDAMARIKGFKGVTGTIGYAPGQRVPKKGVTIIKMDDQTFRFAEEIAPPQIQ